jgi:hypothetical protein
MFDVSSRMKTPKPKHPTPKKSQALSPKRNGPFQYWCLMCVVLYLCGCASSRPIVSTKNTPPGNASVRKIDFSEAPEVRALAERARQIGNEMYPRVVALLADDSSKIPRQFDIVFKKHLAGYFGQTAGATINLRAAWFAKNPTDLDETLIHEMSHVAQKYPSKAWDYWGEGIADYVCYKQPPRDIGRRLTV